MSPSEEKNRLVQIMSRLLTLFMDIHTLSQLTTENLSLNWITLSEISVSGCKFGNLAECGVLESYGNMN